MSRFLRPSLGAGFGSAPAAHHGVEPAQVVGELWEKGATSGNRMAVVDVRLDCDDDSVLLRVHPSGPACHTGETSCFFTAVEP